jgi:pimeloyl-ACP methyl ester carboxylesterase
MACIDAPEQPSSGAQPAPLLAAATLPPPVQLSTACESISTALLGVGGLKLDAAETVTASYAGQTEGENYPEHCRLAGKLDERTGIDGKPYAIGFELRVPKTWNRRFLFQGGGGTDGMVFPALGVAMGTAYSGANALSLGFAVVSMDGGHTADDSLVFIGTALFGLDPQARIDYGYNALGRVAGAAKQMVSTLYATPIERSYFMGCSNGGRQAMVAAARFADQFDGIAAANPGFNLPKAGIQHAWDHQQLRAIDPAVSNAFSAAEMKLLGDSLRAKCDALDGAQDGMVLDVASCSKTFVLDSDVPSCAGTQRAGNCLTAQQKQVLRNILGGPVNSRGEALYADWPWDPGIGSENFMGWRGWKLGIPLLGGLSLTNTMGAAALAYVFTTPPVNLAEQASSLFFDEQAALRDFLAGYDFDVDAPKIFATSGSFGEPAASFMIPPDNTQLSSLVAHSGKLLVFHGTADPVFSANDTVRWYEELGRNVPDAAAYARLFLIPGMSHCMGGPATDRFDALTALVDWVENGVAPEAVLARVSPASEDLQPGWSTTRTRPLCAYPKHAALKPGASDLESATSFDCQ